MNTLLFGLAMLAFALIVVGIVVSMTVTKSHTNSNQSHSVSYSPVSRFVGPARRSDRDGNQWED